MTVNHDVPCCTKGNKINTKIYRVKRQASNLLVCNLIGMWYNEEKVYFGLVV